MTHTLLETVQHARVVARDLVQDAGFVSHVHHGLMPGNLRPTSIHYLGRQRFSDDCRMFLQEEPGQPATDGPHQTTGLVHFLRDRHHLAHHADGADVDLLDTFLEVGGAAHGPVFAPYVDALLPVRATMDAQLTQFRSVGARKKMQRTLRKGVAWRVSRESADFDHFYQDIYLPTALVRFGADARLAPREEMEQHFRKVGLLLFTGADAGCPESGALLCTFPHRPGLLHYWKVGVAQCGSLTPAELTEPYNRLETALLEYAVRERFAEIHMGVTRALINDGVFIHKRRFGCLFHHNRNYADFIIRSRPARLATLLMHRPIALWRAQDLVCWLGQDGELRERGEEDLKDRLMLAAFPPVRSVTVFTRGVHNTRAAFMGVIAQLQADHPCPWEVIDSDSLKD